MGIQAKSKVDGQTKPLLESADLAPATESLLGYYRAIDLGATRWVVDQAAERACDLIHPVILAAARRLVGRRTGLRDKAAVQASEEVSQLVLSNLLTRVKAGSPVRRFDPAKRNLGAFVWVLVDRAIISDICRRRLPVSFSTLDLAAGDLMCVRNGAPAEELEHRDQAEELRQAVQLLPEATRQVMSRVYLEGKGKKKVAQSMGRSPSFVTREIAKGLTLLKGILGQLSQTGKWPQAISENILTCRLEA